MPWPKMAASLPFRFNTIYRSSADEPGALAAVWKVFPEAGCNLLCCCPEEPDQTALAQIHATCTSHSHLTQALVFKGLKLSSRPPTETDSLIK